MKRFSFPLERVLQFRRQVEELELARLHNLAAQRRLLLEQAGRMAQQSQLVRAEPASRTVVTALEVTHAYEYARTLQQAREKALGQAEQREEQRRAQLGVVLRARRDRRLLELLRAKKRLRYRRMADREQERLADELYLAARGRKTSPESSQQ